MMLSDADLPVAHVVLMSRFSSFLTKNILQRMKCATVMKILLSFQSIFQLSFSSKLSVISVLVLTNFFLILIHVILNVLMNVEVDASEFHPAS